MALDIHSVVASIAFALWAASQAYVLYAIRCIARRESGIQPLIETPAVTILKPLCDAEPGLLENLLSFCRQDYPNYQIVFGVRAADDPALNVVDEVKRQFPALDISSSSTSTSPAPILKSAT